MSQELRSAAQALVDGWDSLKMADLAKMLAGEVEVLRKALLPQQGSAAEYDRMTPDKRSELDRLIKTIDEQRAVKRESRDRRKIDLPYQASGLPERRLSDRRSKPRPE